jgi:uncharacterized OB-fold protein
MTEVVGAEKAASFDVMYGWTDLFCPDEEGQGPALFGSRCSDCGYIAFPSLQVCPKCLKTDIMLRHLLSKKGKLENFSVVRQAPKGFRAPYIQAFVRLPEGLAIFTHLVGVDPDRDPIEIGTIWQVTAAVVRIRDDGQPLTGYAFEPSWEMTDG